MMKTLQAVRLVAALSILIFTCSLDAGAFLDTAETHAAEHPFRFSVGQYDSAPRYYDPYAGRFITRDPIGDGVNWYAYVDNNPLVFIDPFGLRKLTEKERKQSQLIFGGTSLDLDRVRIKHSHPVINRFVPEGRAVTFHNSIYGAENDVTGALLQHELLHVWQYNNKRIGPEGAAVQHAVSALKSGSLQYDYSYTVDSIHDPNRRHFREYDFEEQGAIIQDAYTILTLEGDIADLDPREINITNINAFTSEETVEIYEQFVREFKEWDKELQQKAAGGGQSSGSR